MATIYWRGNRAYLNWSERGRQWRRSLGEIDAGEAEAIRAAKEAELRHGVRILPRLPLVRDFLRTYVRWYEAEHPTTTKKLKSELKAFLEEFGGRNVDTIRPLEVEQWKAGRLAARAPETVGKEIRRLKAAFARGMAWGELDVNPVAYVSAPRGARSVAVQWYTKEQIAELAKTARGPLWVFAANTGMRRGELAKATKDDIVETHGSKRIRIESTPDETGKGRTKSGKWREVPLNAAALKALDALPDRLAGGVHPDTISDWFAEDAKGIGGSLHKLRHTFCAHLAMAGVALRRIQLLAGHSSIQVTEMYAHLSPEGGVDAVGKLDLG